MGKIKRWSKPKRNVKHHTYVKDLQQHAKEVYEKKENANYLSKPLSNKPTKGGNYADTWDAPPHSRGHQRSWKNQKQKRQFKNK